MGITDSRAEMSRRGFLRAGVGGAAGVAGWSLLGQQAGAASAPTGTTVTPAGSGGAALEIPFNTGWLFGPWTTGSDQPGFDDAGFSPVTVPHCVAHLSWNEWNPASWEQVWAYRRHFDLPAGFDKLRTFVDFDGALTTATPTINGVPLAPHQGGYLPFSYELTEHLGATGNLLAVKLDSTWQAVPPEGADGGAQTVDYLEPGGLYRDVTLRAVPQVFIADVFAKPVDVLSSSPTLEVLCTIDAAVVPPQPVRLGVVLRDGGRTVGSATADIEVTRTGQVTATVSLDRFGSVRLWDVDDPHLYDVVTTVYIGDQPIHDFTRRTGFREAVFKVDGFYLNGRRLKLFGLDRHQIFPYTGMSMPDRVQRRDAAILRQQLNCNMVRCSHYPQSPAFLDACDELGLMVWQETPGWGYVSDSPAWQNLVVDNVRDMVVRDRSRPSVIIWGVQVNESPREPTLYTQTKNLANSLDGTRQTSGSNTSQSLVNWVQEVFAYDDYSHENGDAVLQPPVPGVPYLVTEAVGTLDGAPFYRRIDTQAIQQEQARLHAQVHDIAASDNAYSGLLGWCGFDYDSLNGNIYKDVKWPGVIDTFRVPKPGAAFYQAQVSPSVRPVIEPAFYWDFGPTSPVTSLGETATIWSNCDRLEAYLNGAHHATLTPATGDFPHLLAPPFYLDVSGIDGSTSPELRLDGYVGTRRVTSRSFSADTSGDRLQVTVDDTELVADGSDATRVEFRAVDRYGAPRPYVEGAVTVEATGPAIVVGDVTLDVTTNPGVLTPGQTTTVVATVTNGGFAFGEAGGVGAVWVRTLWNRPGDVVVRVSHPTLGSGEVRLRAVAPTGPQPTPPQRQPDGVGALGAVTLGLTAPDGWSVRATTPTTVASVAQGAKAAATWLVAVPATAAPGTVTGLEATARFTLGGQVLTETTPAPIGLATSLTDSFDNVGISDDGDSASITAADFDGAGNSYSRQALATAGLTSGASLSAAGVTFVWPDVPAGKPDNTVANGQTILLSGSGTKLAFLGASSPGDEGGSGTIFYTDGSTSGYTVTLDNYFSAPDSGNGVVATLPYINDSSSAYASTGGKRAQTVYLFSATVPLVAGKTVHAVSLPTGGSNPTTGRITGMHVFALGIG